jgi:hypothetical protein
VLIAPLAYVNTDIQDNSIVIGNPAKIIYKKILQKDISTMYSINNKICFLVLSCDKYSDLWNPYAQLFERYWPDCPFDKYFATNQIPFDKYGFQSILMGEDKTWSMGLIDTLNKLKDKYDYVLITLEDLFLIEKVDTTYIADCINEFADKNGNYLRLFTRTEIHKGDGEYINTIVKNLSYRHNCVYAMWKIETLSDILIPAENAWEFEKIGAKRTANMDGFFYSNKNAFVFSNVVIKGKWRRAAIKEIQQLLPGLEIKREAFSVTYELYFYLYVKFFLFCQEFSYKIRTIKL